MEPRADVAAAVMLACCEEDCGLTVPQRVVLQVVVSRESVTLEQLAKTMACSKRQVERHLEKMLSAQKEPAARPALLSYEGRRPATFRPNWYELAEWAAARQEPYEGVISVALATRLTRSKDANSGAIATDMTRTVTPLARRMGTPAAPPAAPAADPDPAAAANPEPDLQATCPQPLSEPELKEATTSWVKRLRGYGVSYPPRLKPELAVYLRRGFSNAELEYAARETARCCQNNPVSYFESILDRIWKGYVKKWPQLRGDQEPTQIDYETGEILDSTSSEAPDELTVARMLRAAR